MARTNVSNTYTNTSAVSIPSNADAVTITIAGARGGDGGVDGGASGGPGAGGRRGVFRYITNFVNRNITVVIGAIGSNGANNARGYGGGAGGGSGLASGGTGGNAAGRDGTGYSGGGGGGGGATGILNNSGTPILVSGGGGGGGGGSWDTNAFPGQGAGGWATSVGGLSNGGNGTSAGYDGGGGGGGGGGCPGGGGGFDGIDQNRGGGGGAGGSSGYNSSVLQYISGDSLNSGTPFIQIDYQLVTPQITNFSYSPNPQNSGNDGIPDTNVTLSWSTVDATSVTIDQGIGAVSSNGSTTVNTGLQSVVGSNSPATKTYTLTACAGSTCVTQSVTVEVSNDNTPTSYTVPNQTNLEPNTLTTISVGTIQGIDMVTSVNGGPGVQVSNNNSSWSSTTLISPNGNVWVRAVSPAFNTDPSGLTNSSQFYVDIGTVRRFFTLTTRAPDVNETFNISNYDDKVPYPDIDTIAGSPDQYITTAPLTVDDVEIDVEVQTNNSNAQVRIKPAGSTAFGSWQDVRSI
jgi:hypothetical protein